MNALPRLGRLVLLSGAVALGSFCVLMQSALAGPDDAPQIDTRAQDLPMVGDDSPYMIGPQNMIQIKVFGEADGNSIYRVDELGFIRHALIGQVKLSGLSVEAAEKLLESKFNGDYYVDPKVTVFILEHSHFSMLGEVRRPGNYEIVGRISIIKAISMAGGFTPVANQRGIKIVRRNPDGNETNIDVDTTRITGRGDLSGQAYLEADDVVVVPKSFF